VTEEGLKKNPPGPTITVTVAALAIVGRKTRNGAMIATNTAMRSEEVFIASITTACDADSLVQLGKSNTPVTFPDCRSALSKRSSLNDQTLSCEAPVSEARTELMMLRESYSLHGAPYESGEVRQFFSLAVQ
jgi:hypothetical protein